MTLALELLVAAAMVVLTVLIHLIGLIGLIALMRRHGPAFRAEQAHLGEAAMVLVVVLGLFLLHMIEIWAYAALYRLGGAVQGLENALLYSTANYVAAGTTDVRVGRAWRLVGVIEGANGILLLGWSTAFFVSIVARIKALEDDWLRRE